MDKIKYIKLLNDIAREFIEREGNLSHKNFLRFFDRIQNQQDYLVMLTASDSDFDELSEVLKFSFPIIDDIINYCIDSDDAKKAIFDIGRLYGSLQLSSRICYEKKKDYQVYETALSVCGIKHFDEIITLLDSQEELTETEICKELELGKSEFIEGIEKLIDENMVVSRRSGKSTAYALSDDGLRFARLRSIEKEHEKEFSSSLNEQNQEMILVAAYNYIASILNIRVEQLERDVKLLASQNKKLINTGYYDSDGSFINDFEEDIEIVPSNRNNNS